MKTLLTVLASLLLLATFVIVFTAAGLAFAGADHADFNGQPLTGAPRVVVAAFGLFIAAIAVMFALVVAALAVAGALLAVVAALVQPLLIPLTILFVLILVVRQSPRRQTVTPLVFNAGSTNLVMTTNGLQFRLDPVYAANAVFNFASTDLVNWLAVFTNPPATGWCGS